MFHNFNKNYLSFLKELYFLGNLLPVCLVLSVFHTISTHERVEPLSWHTILLTNEVHNKYKAACLCVLGYTFCERTGRTVKDLYLAGCLTQKTSQAE